MYCPVSSVQGNFSRDYLVKSHVPLEPEKTWARGGRRHSSPNCRQFESLPTKLVELRCGLLQVRHPRLEHPFGVRKPKCFLRSGALRASQVGEEEGFDTQLPGDATSNAPLNREDGMALVLPEEISVDGGSPLRGAWSGSRARDVRPMPLSLRPRWGLA
jgi:hypothetical protein